MRRLLLSAFGLGWIPPIPGTVASAATVGAVLAVHGAAFGPATPLLLALLAFGIVTTLVLGGSLSTPDGHGDPGWVVTDEVAGQALALVVATASSSASGFWLAGLSFLLFRVLDITKPGVIGAAERLPRGLGILSDDLIAGAIAGVLAGGIGSLLR